MELSRAMKGKRKDDRPGTNIWFRSDRMINESGQWYFTTREGTIEGPYINELQASQALETYIRMMNINIAPTNTKLEPETTPDTRGTLRRRQLGSQTLH
jgi:hypothetical protein